MFESIRHVKLSISLSNELVVLYYRQADDLVTLSWLIRTVNTADGSQMQYILEEIFQTNIMLRRTLKAS